MENVTQGASGEDKESSEPGSDEIIIVITEAEKRVESDEEEANTEDDKTKDESPEVKRVEEGTEDRQTEDDEVDKPNGNMSTGAETVEGSTQEASLEQTQANSEQNTDRTGFISELYEEDSDPADWDTSEETMDIPRVICVDYIRAKGQEETRDYGYTLETVAEDTFEGSDKDDDDDDEIPVSLVDWDGPIQEEMDGTELADSEFEFTRWSGEEANNIEETLNSETAADDTEQNQDDSDQVKGINEQELKMVDRAIAGLETAEEYIEQETTFDPEKGNGVDQTQADVRVILTTVDAVVVEEENLEEENTEENQEEEMFGQSYGTWKRVDDPDKCMKNDTAGQVEIESEGLQECRGEGTVCTQEVGTYGSNQAEVNQEASWEDVVIIVSTVEEVEPSLTVKEVDVDWSETTSDEPHEGSGGFQEEDTTGFDEKEVELDLVTEEVSAQDKGEETCDVEVGVQQRKTDSEKKVKEEITNQVDTRESTEEGNAFSPVEFSTAKMDTDLEKTRNDLETLVSRAERAVPDLEKARQVMDQEKVRGDELNTELKLIKEELAREKTRAQEEKKRADRAEAKFEEARKNMEQEKAKTDLLRLNLEQQKSKAERVETEMKKIQKTVETEKARSQGKKRIETEALEQARRDIEYEKIRAENAEAELKKVQRELETIEERYLEQRRVEAEIVLKARRDAEYEKARANRLRLDLRTLKENKSAGKENDKDSQVQHLQSELESMRTERDQEKARADRLEADASLVKENAVDDASNTTRLEQALKTMKQEKARADRAETYFQQARRECEQEKVRAQLEKRRADHAEASVEQKQKHVEQEKTRANRAIAELKETRKQLNQEKLRYQENTTTLHRSETDLKQARPNSEETNANDTAETELQKLREQLEQEKARAGRAEEEAKDLKEATAKPVSLTGADKLYVRDEETELERTRQEVEQERARTELMKEELEKTIKDFKMEKLRVQEEKIRADLAEAELRNIREKESRVTFRQELEKVWDDTKAKAKVEARLSQTDLHLTLDSTTWDGYKLETSF
ncbi:calponin homology domain-containing protein DDB_G0272472-like [Branchiostoma lanceolatum]|uniref:calponin homology domain-containing protein DDB_G0272472-like n=1 Tax=Branchiostoma lanceolatum TaxID=7740 RepID=UPI003456FBD7